MKAGSVTLWHKRPAPHYSRRRIGEVRLIDPRTQTAAYALAARVPGRPLLDLGETTDPYQGHSREIALREARELARESDDRRLCVYVYRTEDGEVLYVAQARTEGYRGSNFA